MANRVGGLWDRLTSFEHLVHSAFRAAEGKRKRGDVAAYFLNLEPRILNLRRQLLGGAYRPGPYRTFHVMDPKPRQISAAPFADRVVHHALTGMLEPVFERRFSPNSFACRMGRGTHAALARAREGAARHRYCLRCDVRKYFASPIQQPARRSSARRGKPLFLVRLGGRAGPVRALDQAILVEMLARVIRCRPTLDLAETIIAGSNPQEEVPWYFPGDDLFTPFERRRGLPLGNQTSQFFANVYLNGMDQFIDRQVKPPVYVRYVDDWVVFDDDKERLGELRVRLEAELARVRLRMHPGKSRVYRCRDGLTFLGWRLFPGHARLARGNVVATQRRMRRLQERASSTGNE